MQRDNHGRSRGAHQAGLVLADAVTHAFHFDKEAGRPSERHDVEAVFAQSKPTLEFPQPVDVDLEFAAVAVDTIPVRPYLPDGQLVAVALVVELDGAADGVAGTGSTAACRGEKGCAFDTFVGFVRVDRRCDQCDVGR